MAQRVANSSCFHMVILSFKMLAVLYVFFFPPRLGAASIHLASIASLVQLGISLKWAAFLKQSTSNEDHSFRFAFGMCLMVFTFRVITSSKEGRGSCELVCGAGGVEVLDVDDCGGDDFLHLGCVSKEALTPLPQIKQIILLYWAKYESGTTPSRAPMRCWSTCLWKCWLPL